MSLTAVKYQVHGKVQKVFFRKYTEEMANALGLKGYVQNTADGTVVGELEGPTDKVSEMKVWLSSKGSPKSVIERADFSGERTINEYSYSSFQFRR